MFNAPGVICSAACAPGTVSIPGNAPQGTAAFFLLASGRAVAFNLSPFRASQFSVIVVLIKGDPRAFRATEQRSLETYYRNSLRIFRFLNDPVGYVKALKAEITVYDNSFALVKRPSRRSSTSRDDRA